MKLTFKSSNHSYWLGDERIPGVNEILEKVGIKKPYKGDPYYGEIGKASALAIKYYLEGVLDESTVASEVAPRLAAWKKFEKEKGYQPFKWELPLDNGKFAGTFDHVGMLEGKKVLLDTKCVKELKHYETNCQLAGYWMLCYDARLIELQRMGALRLDEDANYELVWYDTPSAADIWEWIWGLYCLKTKK